MTHDVYLRSIVGRLTPEVGTITRADLSRAGGDHPSQNEFRMSGRGHLADALLRAKAALATGDAGVMALAVPHCMALERTGRQLAEKAGAIGKQRAAGKARGATQTNAAAAVWKPYQERFQAMLERGVDKKTARRLVGNMKVRDEAASLDAQNPSPPASAQAAPSAPTLRRWLK